MEFLETHKTTIFVALVGLIIVLLLGWVGWKLGQMKKKNMFWEDVAADQVPGGGMPQPQSSVVSGTPVVVDTTPKIPPLPPTNSNLPQMYLDLLTVVPGEKAILAKGRGGPFYVLTKMPQRDVWAVSKDGKSKTFESWGDLCTNISKLTKDWKFIAIQYPDGKTLTQQRTKPPRQMHAATDEPWLTGTYCCPNFINAPPRSFDK